MQKETYFFYSEPQSATLFDAIRIDLEGGASLWIRSGLIDYAERDEVGHLDIKYRNNEELSNCFKFDVSHLFNSKIYACNGINGYKFDREYIFSIKIGNPDVYMQIYASSYPKCLAARFVCENSEIEFGVSEREYCDYQFMEGEFLIEKIVK